MTGIRDAKPARRDAGFKISSGVEVVFDVVGNGGHDDADADTDGRLRLAD